MLLRRKTLLSLIVSVFVAASAVAGLPGAVQAQDGPARSPITPENATLLVPMADPIDVPPVDGAEIQIFWGTEFAGNSQMLVSTVRYGGDPVGSTAVVWDDVADFATFRMLDPVAQAEFRDLTVHPTDGTFVTGEAAGYVKSWDATTGASDQLYRAESASGQGLICKVNGHINAVAYAPDGETLLIGEVGGTMNVLPDGREFDRAIRGNTCLGDAAGIITDIAWIADGTQFVVARRETGEGWVEIWDRETLEITATFDGFDQVDRVDVTPDGAIIIVRDSYEDAEENWHGSIHRIDVASEEVTLIEAEIGLGLDLSPDGTLLAYSDNEGGIVMYDVVAGETLGTLEGHDISPFDLDFSPDGTMLVSTDLLQVRLWGVGDSDGDGLNDGADNCPLEANPEQEDTDGDAVGDACDACPDEPGDTTAAGCPDGDADGVADAEDNCPADANPDQADFNNDGEGDACADADMDEVLDADDACPEEAGSVDAAGCPDADGDGVADADDLCPDEPGTVETEGCPDSDTDGVPDTEDNCPDAANADQADFNNDGEGDACGDADGDDVLDADDACPEEAGAESAAGCPDTDGDGLADNEDACPDEPGDPEADGCPDTDGDGVTDNEDNCPDDANPDQADFNNDGEGDACQDSDDDEILDADDACPDQAGLPEAGGCLYTGTNDVLNNLNLRGGPGTNFEVVGQVEPGEEYTVLGRNEAGDWLYVRSAAGDEAWLFADLDNSGAVIDELPLVETE